MRRSVKTEFELLDVFEFAGQLLMTLLCGFDQGAEEGARADVFVHGALGVPLHGQDEMIGRSAFQGFDDAVVGAAGDGAQTIADDVGGLMVGGVHGYDEFSLRG
jgi:hypothetical protein